MFSLILLRMSEEIRVTMMVHLLGVWINIAAVLSAVWEHNTLVWVWTKTPRSNNRGRFVSTRTACDVVVCEVDSFSVFLNFHCFLRASAATHFHTFLIQCCRSWKRARETGRRGSSLSLMSVCECGLWQTAGVVWYTAGNMAGVLHRQMRRFIFDGWFRSGFWQPQLIFSLTMVGLIPGFFF